MCVGSCRVPGCHVFYMYTMAPKVHLTSFAIGPCPFGPVHAGTGFSLGGSCLSKDQSFCAPYSDSLAIMQLGLGSLTVGGPNNYQYHSGTTFPIWLIVSYMSSIPQNDVGNYLCLYITSNL